MKQEQIEELANMIPAGSYFVSPPNVHQSAIYVPTGSENKQQLLVTDNKEYTMKIYSRQRKDKDSPWEKWQFKYEIVEETAMTDRDKAAVEYWKQALAEGNDSKLEAFKAGAEWQKQQYISFFKELYELANHQDGCYALECIQMRIDSFLAEE